MLVILFLGGITWIGSHQFDPAEPLKSPKPPLNVEVVSLDWKRLFIYPDQVVASVNQLVIPAGAPVHIRLTSASVMNTFFAPDLGSMIYTMNGMSDQLWPQADQPGVCQGCSAHFSGDGFSDMHFAVNAVPASDSATGVDKAHAAGRALDADAYASLVKQSANIAPFTYRTIAPDLFDSVVRLRQPPGPGLQPPAASSGVPRTSGARMFGTLSWDAIPFDQPIPMAASAFMVLAIGSLLALIVLKGWAP